MIYDTDYYSVPFILNYLEVTLNSSLMRAIYISQESFMFKLEEIELSASGIAAETNQKIQNLKYCRNHAFPLFYCFVMEIQ